MRYKQARELAILPFIFLFNIVNVVVNDVLSFSTVNITIHLLLASGLGWFFGTLFWAFISGHYIEVNVDKLTLTREDIKFITDTVEKYKINRNITYSEFDRIVKESIEICRNKIYCDENELEVFVLAAACLQYKILGYGNWRRGIREIRYLENENFDAVQIIEYVTTGN